MRYLIDTSAWIEYLEGSKEGEKVNNLLIKENEIYTISIIISEVVSKVKRKNSNTEIAYSSIIKNSKIFDLTPRVSKEAGLLHAEIKEKNRNFSLVDALILCSAKALKAKLVTKDSHFKSFKNIIFI